MRTAIITISTSKTAEPKSDESGPVLAELARAAGAAIVAREIIDAKIIKGYTVRLIFDDLEKRVVDLRKFLDKGIFSELRDPKKFRRMKVDAELGTICWPNGADIAPDRLYRQ